MRKLSSKCGGTFAEPPGNKGEGYLGAGRGTNRRESLGKAG